MRSHFRSSILILLLCLFLSASAVSASDDDGDDVVFYPTDVSQAGELAYLRDSVRMMLASRLSGVAGIQPRFEEVDGGGKVVKYYRVQSRVVSDEKKVIISVSVVEPSNDFPFSFETTAADNNQVVEALDDLVAQLGEAFFDVKSQPAQTSATSKAGVVSDFHTPHPDRQIKENSGFGLFVGQDDFVSQKGGTVSASERYKSAVFSFRSKAMTAGDLDGDGFDEIILSTNTKLYIYQLRNEKIQKLDTISLPGSLKVHAVNVADLDNNGVMEIYLSSTKDRQPQSFVLEWQVSTGVKWLYKYVHWYLRPITLPGEGVVLAGQKGGVSGMTAPGIFKMIAQPGDGISGDERFYLPESVDLFDFVFADLDAQKPAEIVVLNSKEQLQVYNADLQLLYTSPAGFGGRELLEEYTAPIRLVVVDFDNDGCQDILLVDNELYSPKILHKTRLYKNGQVRGLSWGRDGFVEVWHTNLFQNSIADFHFFSKAGADGDVAGRLFVVEPEAGDLLDSIMLGKGGSRLSVFGMLFFSKVSKSVE